MFNRDYLIDNQCLMEHGVFMPWWHIKFVDLSERDQNLVNILFTLTCCCLDNFGTFRHLNESVLKP
jgi:hypothetical protein